MGRIIIVEGPDGGGKTTLTERISTIARSLGTVALHNHGAYLGEPAITHHYMQSIELAATFDYVILDRCWISEPIYGTAMRGGVNRLPWIDYRFLSMKANEYKAQVIFCMPPLDACIKAWAERREIEYVDAEDKMTRVHQLYNNTFAEMYLIPKRFYDYTRDPTADNILKDVFPPQVLAKVASK